MDIIKCEKVFAGIFFQVGLRSKLKYFHTKRNQLNHWQIEKGYLIALL